jgi:hypothetical protein
MQISDLSNDVRDHSRDAFVSNECGTDEYRETEPGKAFVFISEMFDDFSSGSFPQGEEMQAVIDIRNWLDAIIRITNDPNSKPWEVSYAGATELEPVLNRMHDMAWRMNRHPYDRSPEELLADYNEDKEDKTETEPEHHAH